MSTTNGTATRREIYEALKSDPEAPFVSERAPLFSPAAAAQDAGTSRSAVGRFGPMYLPLEYTSWADEAAAHVESCYLGDWSSLSKARVSGPDAEAVLSRVGVNDLSRFRVGGLKHHIQLDENGWIASEGILRRVDRTEFLYTAGSTQWLHWQAEQLGADVAIEDVTPDVFVFGVQGPRSAAVLRTLVGEGIDEIPFNGSAPADLAGASVEVLRTGISGELGFEVHGDAADGDAVWSAIRAAGEPQELRQLGFRAQPVQHVEAGIATNGLDYLPASILTPAAPWEFKRGLPGGSFVPEGITDYFRRPAELGWGGRVHLSHEFTGRQALVDESAAGGPERVLVGLEWDVDDVLAVFRALFEEGDRVDPMELPKDSGPSFDRVIVDGRDVGVSSGRGYSAALRQTQSLAVLRREHAAPGTPVHVVWGRPGTRQMHVRALVRSLPFKPDRRRAPAS